MYKMKRPVKNEADICKYNCMDCGGSSTCLLRGQTWPVEKLGLAQDHSEEKVSEFPAPESCTWLSHPHLCQYMA